jgi:S-adenosylhomocysteine hydrolase
VDTDYFAIAVPLQYVSNSNGKRVVDQTYEDCKSIMDAIFSSERLKLPFRGVLIIGY